MRLCLAVLALLVSAGLAWSEPACPQHFYQGEPPVIVRESLGVKTRSLCFTAFATLHSGVSRGPIYSAEHLTRVRLAGGHAERVNAFHPEPEVPAAERSELRDYQRSGFDRGHMAPAADMTTPAEEHDSFSLANMVPQVHANNAGLWARIEAQVRDMAVEHGELYVVTGPLFEGETIPMIGHGVLVPSHIWKATLDPATGETWAVLVTNTAQDHMEIVPLSELEKRVGLKIFTTGGTDEATAR